MHTATLLQGLGTDLGVGRGVRPGLPSARELVTFGVHRAVVPESPA